MPLREAPWLPTFERAWPAGVDAVGPARRQVVGHLRRGGVHGRVLGDIELAVGEALSNVALHAYDVGGPGEMRVRVAADGCDAIEVAVADDGRGLGPGGGSGLGLGLPVMSALSARIELRSTPGRGACVRMWFQREA